MLWNFFTRVFTKIFDGAANMDPSQPVEKKGLQYAFVG